MVRIFYQKLFLDVVIFGIIAIISLCVGLVINEFRAKPLSILYQTKSMRLQQSVDKIAGANKKISAQFPLPSKLSLGDFRVFVEQKQGLVLDARPEIFHRFGHVPGALSLPQDDFESGYAKLKTQLESDKNQPLVVYCSGTSCEDSRLVQKALLSLGYKNVSVFRGGWAEWLEAGLPEEKAQ